MVFSSGDAFVSMEGFMAVWSKDSGTCAPSSQPWFRADPYPPYRHPLAGPSLQPLEGRPGVWLLFGYEACTTVIRDGRLSAKRPAKTLVNVADDALPEFDDLVRHMQRWLLLRDAPRHTELRKLMNRGFTPAVVDRLKDKVDAIVDSLLDEMRNAETVDLIKDFAYPLPVRVICELMGVPEELHDRCVVLSNDIAVWIGDFRRPPESARVAQRAVLELEGYFAATVRERRGAPKDDLLGLLMDAGVAAGGLSEEDLLAQCVMLLFAGHETTRNLIGNGIFTLLKNPDALGELRRDDGLWPAAVEELLRYESPVQGFGRSATADLEVEGRHLPAGSFILVIGCAAHPGARQHPDPDRR